MDDSYEIAYHALENNHWWFRSRREMVLFFLKKYAATRKAKILEVGCSSGELLVQLEKLGYVNTRGIDISTSAITACKKKGVDSADVMDASKISFQDSTFDILIASDILEHVADDRGALEEWRRVLQDSGTLILFVPAFPFLWSQHDVANQHYRRYKKKALLDTLRSAGFSIQRSSYWNCILLFPVSMFHFVGRLGLHAYRKKKDNLYRIPSVINAGLLALLKIENWLVRKLNFPFGVSLFVIAKKKDARQQNKKM